MAIVKKITINGIAQTTGVSVNTVSLVLSGKGRISDATNGWASQAIEQLGFVHGRQAASLRGEQSGVIGLTVNDLSRPFCAELTAGLIDILERQGRMVFLIQDGRSGEKINQRSDTLAAQGVDRVIIVGSIDHGSELRGRAARAGVPLMFASRASCLDDADLIHPDNMQVAQLVAEHPIRRGHQRIAWLDGQNSPLTCAEWVGDYCVTLLKYGLLFHNEWVLECESSQRQAVETMTRLLRQSLTITAVLCYNSMVTTDAWFGLLRVGRQSGEGDIESYFGQRVALMALVDVPEAVLDDLPFTWVTTPAREMGRTLTESILRWLEEGTGEARNQIMPPRLVTRK